MKPEEKAKELIEQFLPMMYCYMGSGMLSNDYDENVARGNAKASAIICVDEILKDYEQRLASGAVDFITIKGQPIEYWNEVREHLTKS